MKEAWLIGAYAAVLATVPAHLNSRITPREGGLQSQQSLPIPAVAGERQYVLIYFYESSGPVFGKMPDVYPPFASAQVFFPDKEVHWNDVKPEALGLTKLPVDEEKKPYLGTLERGNFSMEEWRNANKRYDVLISQVLERRWLLTRHPITVEERASARELQDCTRILYDKPLLPYYQYAGRQFLAWMERAAK